MIDIKHLRTLNAIAETQKLALAAERVHLTQSALSHQIRAIEQHYAIELFKRTAYGLRFTPAGERLLQLAQLVLAATADAERDLQRMKNEVSGELRIALECHTCFDWLTLVMERFRRAWPEVELDLVAGFHSDPLQLLAQDKADVVIGRAASPDSPYISTALFRYEILAALDPEHVLQNKAWLEAEDFRDCTLITYPVAPERIDLIREVLQPAGIPFQRRTAELTVAIMQLVASRRGMAALPVWGLHNYIAHEYILGKRIGKNGLWSELYATTQPVMQQTAYMQEFMQIIRSVCLQTLNGVVAAQK